jgi:hypothetical protein
MYTKREVIRGMFKELLHADRTLEKQAGSWSLDPLATLLPTQNLVQMFLDGQAVKKRRFRRQKAPDPPTAKFSSRHGGIQATLRVIGDSYVRSTATIRSETRGGNIVLDLVS